MSRLQTLYDFACHRELQTVQGRVSKFAHEITAPRFARGFIADTVFLMGRLVGGEYFGYITPRYFYDNLTTVRL